MRRYPTANLLSFLLISGSLALLFLTACEEKPYNIGRPLTEQEKHGEQLYGNSCRTCHRAESDKPLSGPGLAGVFRKPYLPSGRPANDETIKQTIVMGRNNMPGYKAVFSDKQIDDVIAYLHTL